MEEENKKIKEEDNEEGKEETKHQEILEKRKNKIKKFFFGWVEDNHDKIFIGILILIIAIRFYYFWITKDQPLWFDEADYLSIAKGYAGIVDYKISAIRLPGFPLLASIFFIVGISNEVVLRFFLTFIPSILMIILFYILMREMYLDKRIALISTIILGVLWENLFYSNRFHTENFAFLFQLFATLIFFKVYMKKEPLWVITPKYSLLWILLLSGMSVLFRPGNLPFIPSLVVFFFILNQSYFFDRKKKIYSFIVLIALFFFSIFFVTNIISKIPILSNYYHPSQEIPWHNFFGSASIFHGFYDSVIPWMPQIFYYFFLAGVLFSLAYLFLLYDNFKKIKRDRDHLRFKSDIYNFLLMILVVSVFLFLIRNPQEEYRYFFILLTGMLGFTSRGVIVSADYIQKHAKIKHLSVLIIILVLSLGCYNQLVHSDTIIKMKLDSYGPVKESGLWLKENTNARDTIISASITQHTYYTDRIIYDFYSVGGPERNESLFDETLKELKPKYLVVSVFEPAFTPQWAYEWPNKHQDLVRPVQIYYMDETQSQPALVVYEFIWS